MQMQKVKYERIEIFKSHIPKDFNFPLIKLKEGVELMYDLLNMKRAARIVKTAQFMFIID